jgi:ATP-binding cassette subfamily B protein
VPALIAAYAGPEQIQRERTLLDRWAQIYSRFNEILSGIVIVRSFAMEDAEKARFLNDVAAANKVVIHGVAIDAGYASASNLVVALARLGGLGLGAYFVLQG